MVSFFIFIVIAKGPNAFLLGMQGRRVVYGMEV